MLTQSSGNPVLVSDMATVKIGKKPRLGIAGKDDDDDIVQGIVLMRRGEQSMPTIRRVEREVERINSSEILPPGVRIERIYDRKDLIEVTTRPCCTTWLGIVLIFLLQWIFLGDLRSALIVAATIPFALFFAVGILVLRGESANLLSVGAIDFGLIVDATVIMVESIYRRLGRGEHERVGAVRRRRRRIYRASSAAIFPARTSTGRFSSRPESSSRAFCRCSRSAASKAISSGRWRRPTPMRWPAVCWPRSR